ncbi:cupin domain-containing protein [Eleftheria terrae]|uniref:cupin domain-containing protein n=1 Tax=Eleftheria terrae TaxID=1597781 RepID=UPI00263B567D|nr:cupin domain-containing protein [Eleftheria terrae]WKB53392.1 cupin domain-containing protein [Eleftheria terrae]
MSDHPPSSLNTEGVFEPFHVSRVPTEEVMRGERYGMRFQHLSSFGGGSQISVSLEVLPPGRQANQLHYHLLEEEHVYVLEGCLTLRLGEHTWELQAGHYVCFPAGQKLGHALINRSDQPCRYLVLGAPHPHDVVVFPDTGRIAVKLTGEGYRQSATQGYWEGVDTGGPA